MRVKETEENEGERPADKETERKKESATSKRK
jgi:hypothetical protein